MLKKALIYSAVLIGTYLALSHATEGGQLLSAASGAASGYAKTLQGR